MTEEDVLTEEDRETFFFNPSETWEKINVVLFGHDAHMTSVLDKDGEIVFRVQKLDMTLEVLEPCISGSFFRILRNPDGTTLTKRVGDRNLIGCQIVNVDRIDIFKYEDTPEGKKQSEADWPNAGKQDG